MVSTELERVSSLFATFAEKECRGSSPLYERLSFAIAADEGLLALAARGRTPIPNLFLAAVQYLLLRCDHDPLAEYYPSIRKLTRSDDGLLPAFRSFCIAHRQEIIEIVSTQLVQTNEVRRCGYLCPSFHIVSKLSGGQPLALIDIGTSAGLHLYWDRYHYDYGQGKVYGKRDSRVKIKVELRGYNFPELGATQVPIGARVGIDLKPMTPENADDIDWLHALIWPEHGDRRELLRHALDVVAQEKEQLTLIAGDASDVLGQVLPRVPEESVPCVFQTHSWRRFQLTQERRSSQRLNPLAKKGGCFFICAWSSRTRTFGTWCKTQMGAGQL